MNSRNSMAANGTLHCLTGCAIGFLLGGLVVSVAAQLEDGGATPPGHGSSSQQSLDR